MVHRIVKAAPKHHHSTTVAHASGKRGNPPLVGKRHEDHQAHARVGGHARHPAKRSAHG